MRLGARIRKVVNASRKVGVGIDYVETNSAWFVDSDQADTVLKNLRAAGVGTLLILISPFHNAHIPYVRVNGVIDACRRVGMHIFPWVNTLNHMDTAPNVTLA